MKKILIATQLLLTMAAPAIASGATKTVTIEWTMADTTNVTSYEIFYSYNNSNMAPLKPPCKTNDPTVTSLTCANVSIDKTPIYFVVVAETANGKLTSKSKSFIAPVSVVQNFTVLTPGIM